MVAMRIEHIALWTKDLEKLKDFYIRYFNASSNEKYTNPVKKFESYFLTFEGGARLEIMRRPDIEEQDGDKTYVGYAHIAFAVGS
jgi:lactoylglutathione lyase